MNAVGFAVVRNLPEGRGFGNGIGAAWCEFCRFGCGLIPAVSKAL